MSWDVFYNDYIATMKKLGRDPAEVEIIAVSKAQELAHIEEILKKYPQIKTLGENYFQELEEKRNFFKNKTDFKWHFLGPLQSRKIKDLCQLAHCLDAVSRVKELKILSQVKNEKGVVPDFYLQVNLSGEEQKGGVSVENLPELIEEVSQLNLEESFQGLMGVATDLDKSTEEKVLEEFSTLKNLREQWAPHKKLNMGMSSDYKLALQVGTDVIRVGSLIFGERNYR